MGVFGTAEYANPTLGGVLITLDVGDNSAITTGNTLTDGSYSADPQYYSTGAAVNAFLSTACTDITDPDGTGGWNTIWSFSTGFPKWVQFVAGSASATFRISVGSETINDAIRMQLAVDTVTMFDFTVEADAVNVCEGLGFVNFLNSGAAYTAGVGGTTIPIYSSTSIILKIAREGTLSLANTVVSIPGIVDIDF